MNQDKRLAFGRFASWRRLTVSYSPGKVRLWVPAPLGVTVCLSNFGEASYKIVPSVCLSKKYSSSGIDEIIFMNFRNIGKPPF